MRLKAAFLTLCAVLAAANWFGYGHNYLPLAEVASIFFLARRLPESAWRTLIATLLGFSLAVAALAVAQMWHMDRARGIFISPNLLGSYAVVMLFLAASVAVHSGRAGSSADRACGKGVDRPEPRGRWFESTSVAANLLSVALSQSRGALLALGAGLLVMLWRSKPALAAAGAGAALIVALAIRSSSEQGRAGIWNAGWQAFLHRPLTGWGQGGVFVGGIQSFYAIPLDLAVAAGILGLAAGLWLFIEGIVAARRQPAAQAMLVAWLVSGCFIYGTAATYLPVFLILGRLSRKREHEARQHAQRRRHGTGDAEAFRLDAPA